MNRKRIIKMLCVGIGMFILLDFLKSTSLYFTDAQAIAFIDYLYTKNELLGVSNGFILFVIGATVVCTYLNKLKGIKKVG